MKHGNDKNSKLAAYQMNIIFEEKATGFPIAFQLYFPVFISSLAFHLPQHDKYFQIINISK